MDLYKTVVSSAVMAIGVNLTLNAMNGLSTRVGLFQTDIADAFERRIAGGQ